MADHSNIGNGEKDSIVIAEAEIAEVTVPSAWQNAIAILFEYLKNVIYHPERAELNTDDLPDEFTKLAQGLQYFAKSVSEARTLAADIARGRLDTTPVSAGNEIASDLKNLQATLKHLTWQINQVAKGDYKQRVSFIGDFSDAINNMIGQLAERTATLVKNAQELSDQAASLRENYEMFLALAEHVRQWVIVIDRDTGKILYKNHDAADILNDMADEERLNEWLQSHTLNYDRTEVASIPEEISFGDPSFWDIKHPASQFFQITASPFTWQSHRALTFLISDITEAKRRREELESVAFFDTLTGAYSRHYGMSTLEKWLDQKQMFSICFIDMDNLKYVNDTFGHEAGDAYIVRVSQKLAGESVKSFEREDITLCRLGGDEFMILCRGWSKQKSEQWLESVRSELIAESNKEFQRSISYGVVQANGENSSSGSMLLSQADELMYEYKRSHKKGRKTSKRLINN